VDLLAQFIEPHFVDEPFNGPLDLSRSGLRLRVVTIGRCYESDALKFQASDDSLAFDLVAGQPAQIIDDQNVQFVPVGRTQHFPILWPRTVGAGYGSIRVFANDQPTFGFCPTPAVA
jgi:hypothetical protein